MNGVHEIIHELGAGRAIEPAGCGAARIPQRHGGDCARPGHRLAAQAVEIDPSFVEAWNNLGTALAEIGQVLRHRRPATTAAYTKVNIEALRALARPWPGASS